MLDLPEPDLLEAGYLALGLVAIALVVLALILALGTVIGLRRIAGSHRLGEYPLPPRFNIAYPRLGGMVSQPACDSNGAPRAEHRGEAGAHARGDQRCRAAAVLS